MKRCNTSASPQWVSTHISNCNTDQHLFSGLRALGSGSPQETWRAGLGMVMLVLQLFLTALLATATRASPWTRLVPSAEEEALNEQFIVQLSSAEDCSIHSLIHHVNSLQSSAVATPALKDAVIAVAPTNASSLLSSLPCAYSASPLPPQSKLLPSARTHTSVANAAAAEYIVSMAPTDYADASSASAHSDFAQLCKDAIDARLGGSSAWVSSMSAHVQSASVGAISSISSLPCVHTVGVLPRVQLSQGAPRSRANFATNQQVAGIVQTGNVYSVIDTSNDLHSSEQAIAVVDTGVDRSHCYFRSKNEITYIEYANGEDQNGHGTHVACTALGKGDDSARKEYEGVAPEARLVVFDIGQASPDIGSSLSVPFGNNKNLKENLLDVVAEEGAHIISNSWGSTSVQYDELSQEVDWYVWESNLGLPVFSAGNAGIFGYTSVGTPGLGKNTLSVGASLSIPVTRDSPATFAQYDDFDEESDFPERRRPFELKPKNVSTAGRLLNIFVNTVAVLESGTQKFDTDGTVQIKPADPISACNTKIAATNSEYVLISLRRAQKRGCSPSDTIRNIEQPEGAIKRVLFINDQYACGLRALNVEPTAKVGIVSRKDGELILHAMNATGNGNVEMELSRRPLPDLSSSDDAWRLAIADFSSRGPTWDIRYKPDVIAPGVKTRSADANTGCSTTQLSGTSMSAPAVSGAAALIRQGLLKRDGNDDAPISANLLKAAIINGAQPIEGFTRQLAEPFEGEADATTADNYIKRPIESSPSCEQGFGRVSVVSSLPLEVLGNATDTSVDPPANEMLVREGTVSEEGPQDGSDNSLCVRITGGDDVELRATLVWNDFPGSLLSRFALVNDLDLHARFNETDGFEFQYPLNGKPDGVNTAERMRAQHLKSNTTVQLSVRGFRILKAPQEYALVVSSYGGSITESSECKQTQGLCANRSECATEVEAPSYARFDFSSGELTDEGAYSASQPMYRPLQQVAIAAAGAVVLLLHQC